MSLGSFHCPPDDIPMTYLAMDIGASSGKLVRAELKEGRISTSVVHRFQNNLIRTGGHLCWDIEHLYDELVAGLEKAGPADYVTIDTWAVDFVLLDSRGQLLTPAVSYRDNRTDNVSCPVTREELYARTGIQYQKFNTIYQLLALRKEDPGVLEKAEDLLFIPDYLAWRLTGEKVQEYTNATTSGLVKAGTDEWDYDLIDSLGLPRRLFRKMTKCGKVLGKVRQCGASFILAPTHDTACAVLASPAGPDSLFLSSGTWSLIGCVNDSAVTTRKAMEYNLTNEGAWDGRIRLLKNIMGTWMLQCIRKEAGDISFDEMCKEAQNSRLPGIVDAMDSRFLSPSSMSDEVCAALEEAGRERPAGIGELANVVYNSLAMAYAKAAEQISEVTGRRFTHLAVVGGGCKDAYLNTLAKKYTGLEVTAGPVEGSAVGSILCAMINTGEIRKEDVPAILAASFDIATVQEE